MARKTPTFFYERFTLFGLHPAWFWFFFGLALFLIGVYFVRLDNLPGYWIAWAFYAQGVIIWPNLLIWLYKSFFTTIEIQKNIFWKSERDHAIWIDSKAQEIFFFKDKLSKFIMILILSTGFLGVLTSFLRYSYGNDVVMLILSAVGVIPVGFIAGHAAYIILSLIKCLIELSKSPVFVPFYRLPNPSISKLQNYYSALSLITTFVYIHVLIGLQLSPVGFPPIIVTILAIGGFYPLVLFLFTFIFTHKIAQNIKQSHLNLINEEVQEALERALKGKSGTGYEILKQAMEVQDKVQNMREWPFELSGVITFTITLATGIGQLIVTFIRNP